MVFKVVMHYSGEESVEEDEVFDTHEEAEEFGLVQLSNHETGGEVQHLSNPGDYPPSDDDNEVHFEVIEVDE